MPPTPLEPKREDLTSALPIGLENSGMPETGMPFDWLSGDDLSPSGFKRYRGVRVPDPRMVSVRTLVLLGWDFATDGEVAANRLGDLYRQRQLLDTQIAAAEAALEGKTPVRG